MNINVEFLSSEPIENVITNINYKVDKVIYFGFEEDILKQKKILERFLTQYCEVKKVVFQTVSHYDMDGVITVMRRVLSQETGKNDHVFFDLTGGESFIMAGFGIVATEIKASLHVFDIRKNRLYEMKEFSKVNLGDCVPAHRIALDIDKYIMLHHGKVNHEMHKAMKEEIKPELVDTLWKISTRYQKSWNDYSSAMRLFASQDENVLTGTALRRKLEKEIKNCEKLNFETFKKISKECMNHGLIKELKLGEEVCNIEYPSRQIKDYLWDGGAILEIHTRESMKKESDYCEAGVHIDWDGVVDGKDVLNEIDVVAMQGNIPVFVSCKNGRLGKTQSLHALYELETVADRFGGKYARKIIVVPQGLYSETDALRAKELGIEVRNE